jgi:hypothetical protein
MQNYSAAAQIIVSIIPIVGIVMGSVVIILYLNWQYRRNKMLIQMGQYKPAVFDLRSFSLLTGLLLITVGVTLTVFLSLLEGLSYALLGGVVPLSLGAGLLIYYVVKRYDKAA